MMMMCWWKAPRMSEAVDACLNLSPAISINVIKIHGKTIEILSWKNRFPFNIRQIIIIERANHFSFRICLNPFQYFLRLMGRAHGGRAGGCVKRFETAQSHNLYV